MTAFERACLEHEICELREQLEELEFQLQMDRDIEQWEAEEGPINWGHMSL